MTWEKKISPEMQLYYESDTWQEKRAIRLIIDRFKCRVCGSPINVSVLQVHHTEYPEVFGMEDPYKDLITLCKKCHDAVEKEKDAYRAAIDQQRQEQRERWELERQQQAQKRERDLKMLWQLIKAKSDIRDLHNLGHGDRDYCNIETIKSDFEHLVEEYQIDSVGYINRVQAYNRNKRYEIILDMLQSGLSPAEIKKRTPFSKNMIDKVSKDPEQARKLMEVDIT